MHLIIDIGNSRVKSALFSSGSLVKQQVDEELSEETLGELLSSADVRAAIISSVREDDSWKAWFSKFDFPWILLDSTTALPLTNRYQTPFSLGMDRIAGAVGGMERFPGQDVLVISAGSCLTFDLVTRHKEYLGGSISPGLNMRLKALNAFTGRLPLEKADQGDVPLTGQSTREAILSGVINGMLAETEGIISLYQQQWPGIRVVISGGDLIFFDKKLKNRIFAVENLVLHGLNKILDYNVSKSF